MNEREIRRDIAEEVRRLVVKIGSNLLVSLGMGLNTDLISDLVSQIAQLRRNGYQIVVVSSGAIAAGMDRLQLARRPKTIAELQAAAAIGQSRLMHLYEQAFEPWGITVGQVLLTHDDIRDRKRYINGRNTLMTLLALGIVPIVNENDSVVVEEIKVGDNDTLAALVSALVDAQLLVILTDIDGLYTADPNSGGTLISLVKTVKREVENMARGSHTEIGIGGMTTKVAAARLAARCAIPTIVASGRSRGVINAIVAGDEIGTLFLPENRKLRGKKRWIGTTRRCKGVLQVDEGAYGALTEGGKSLLPTGITAVAGDFGRGDMVSCADEDGNEFARGLVNYDARELQQIMGQRSSRIEEILGYKYTDEVIHRDNLVLI